MYNEDFLFGYILASKEKCDYMLDQPSGNQVRHSTVTTSIVELGGIKRCHDNKQTSCCWCPPPTYLSTLEFTIEDRVSYRQSKLHRKSLFSVVAVGFCCIFISIYFQLIMNNTPIGPSQLLFAIVTQEENHDLNTLVIKPSILCLQ